MVTGGRGAVVTGGRGAVVTGGSNNTCVLPPLNIILISEVCRSSEGMCDSASNGTVGCHM